MKKKRERSISNELKTAFSLVKDNFLSIFLAMLGLLIIGGVAIAAVAAPLGITMDRIQEGQFTPPANIKITTLLLGVIIAIVVLIIISLVMGGLFGMASEITEKGNTSAETPFAIIRENFKSLLWGGILQLLLIFAVPSVLNAGVSLLYDPTAIPSLVDRTIDAITFIWVFITTGLAISTFPGIVDDKNPKTALLESIAKAKSYPRRIFGTLIVYAIILIVIFAPIGLWSFMNGQDPLWIAVYAPVISIFTVLVLFPMFLISFTRMYADIEGKPVQEV